MKITTFNVKFQSAVNMCKKQGFFKVLKEQKVIYKMNSCDNCFETQMIHFAMRWLDALPDVKDLTV